MAACSEARLAPRRRKNHLAWQILKRAVTAIVRLISPLSPFYAPALAAKPSSSTSPGWRLGSEQSNSAALMRLRGLFWDGVRAPVTVPWLEGLHLQLQPLDETSRSIFTTGRYEPNEFRALGQILQPGMTFIDVGANMGLYTMFASKRVGGSGLVVAIEPSGREFRRLAEHVRANRLTNVLLRRVAISDRDAEGELLVADDVHAGHNSLGSFGYSGAQQSSRERVPLRPLDDMVDTDSLARVSVVKLDVEGAEISALRGARRTLEHFRPVMLFELSDITLQTQDATSDEIWELLTELGYELYSYSAATGLPIRAERKSHYAGENLIGVPRNAVFPFGSTP